MLRRGLGPVVGMVCGTLLGICLARPVPAQKTVPQASITAELQSLAAGAQTIFVGQIISIQRRGGVVEVTFRVEQPVAGAAGSTFTVREWAGMWPANFQRYTVGQRVLAFLRGASGAGLSSPVHGAEGLVPVVVQDVGAPRLLDVRRVAASVVRAPGTRLPDQTDGAVGLDEAIGLIRPTFSVSPSQGGVAVSPVRMPLPVRGRPPVEFPEATRAVEGASGARTSRTVEEPELPGASALARVRP